MGRENDLCWTLRHETVVNPRNHLSVRVCSTVLINLLIPLYSRRLQLYILSEDRLLAAYKRFGGLARSIYDQDPVRRALWADLRTGRPALILSYRAHHAATRKFHTRSPSFSRTSSIISSHSRITILHRRRSSNSFMQLQRRALFGLSYFCTTFAHCKHNWKYF